jgi:hypothetical protein
MKSKILFSIMCILLLTFIYVPASYSAGATFNLVFTNDTWDLHKIYEVDVIIQSTTGASLELATFGLGLQFPTASLNGGTVTASYVDGSSELNAAQTPTNAHFTTALSGTNTIVRITSMAAPGSGNGSTISSTAPGTKMYRVRLTNTADWTVTGTNSILVATSTQYPSNFNCYIATVNTNIWNNRTVIYNLAGPLLPVELSSFISIVNGREVDLSWETKTEVNTRHFEIERNLESSKDATVIWAPVGVVQASGTSTTPRKYSFTDKNLQAGKYQYRLKMIDNDGSFKYSKIEETEVALPKNFELSQNYPNPFNPSTKINYSLPFDSRVTLEVYNIKGERIGQIVNEEQTAGYYAVNFSSSSLSRSIASGVYIYKLSAIDKSSGNIFNSIKKMMLIK